MMMLSRTLHIRAALTSAALIAALGAGVATASAAPPKIAYAGLAPGGAANRDIFTISANGTHGRQLTRGPLNDYAPAWSPQRRWIAFTRGSAGCCTPSLPLQHGLYIVRANGSGLKQVVASGDNGITGPSWSPNGKRILFGVPSEEGTTLYTVRRDGSGQRRVALVRGRPVSADWSPNGRWIVFGGFDSFAKIRADGTGRRRLGARGFGPQWSPNGRRIAFVAYYRRSHTREVFTMRANGTHRHPVTQKRPQYVCDDFESCFREEFFPTWRPDGRRIAFAEAGHPGQDTVIFTIRPDGKRAHRVVAGAAPAW